MFMTCVNNSSNKTHTHRHTHILGRENSPKLASKSILQSLKWALNGSQWRRQHSAISKLLFLGASTPTNNNNRFFFCCFPALMISAAAGLLSIGCCKKELDVYYGKVHCRKVHWTSCCCCMCACLLATKCWHTLPRQQQQRQQQQQLLAGNWQAGRGGAGPGPHKWFDLYAGTELEMWQDSSAARCNFN